MQIIYKTLVKTTNLGLLKAAVNTKNLTILLK